MRELAIGATEVSHDCSIRFAQVFGRLSPVRRAAMRFNPTAFRLAAALSHLVPVGYRPVYCLGDSHIGVWNHVDAYRPGFLPRYVPLMLRGATALGLANPNSKTNALKEFSRALSWLPRGSTVLFNLGEVDCGFVIWLIAGRDDLPVEEVFERALASYCDFLASVATQGFRVVVSAAPLPTIGDGPAVGEVAKLRRGVTATQRQRTDLTLAWNQSLARLCTSQGHSFLDTDDILLDGQTMLVRDIYRNSDPGDHHLDAHSYALALLLALRRMHRSATCSEGVGDAAH